MPILFSPDFQPNAGFVFPRPYVCKLALGWVSMTVLTPAPALTAVEHVFGGYVIHINLKNWCWDWSTKRLNLNDLFDDFFVTPPGGGAPLNAGNTIVQWKLDTADNQRYLVIVLAGADGHYSYQDFPPAPSSYWLPTCGDYGS